MKSFFKNLNNEIDKSHKKIRDFGILFALIALVISLLIYWKNSWVISDIMLIFIGISVVLTGISVSLTSLLRPFYILWMMLALVLGVIMTKVIVSIVFYGVMTPIGLFRRLKNKDVLNEAFNSDLKSYWIDVNKGDNPERFKKLY